MGIVSIVAYKPKLGQEAALLRLVKEHVTILVAEGLATDRLPVFGRSSNGTVIEVFEWKSQESIDNAHSNPKVLAMWGAFNALCTFEALATLEECKSMFACFEATDL